MMLYQIDVQPAFAQFPLQECCSDYAAAERCKHELLVEWESNAESIQVITDRLVWFAALESCYIVSQSRPLFDPAKQGKWVTVVSLEHLYTVYIIHVLAAQTIMLFIWTHGSSYIMWNAWKRERLGTECMDEMYAIQVD